MTSHCDDIDRISLDDLRDYCNAVPQYVAELDHYGYTPLIAACLQQNAPAARVLLHAGADPNFIASDGTSPLIAALPATTEPFNREMFDLLFAAGADPNRGLEPVLHKAVGRRQRQLAAYLIEHGADANLNDVDDTPPIFWASGFGSRPDVLMLALLIQLGADPTRRNGVGRTLEDEIGPEAMAEVRRHVAQ